MLTDQEKAKIRQEAEVLYKYAKRNGGTVYRYNDIVSAKREAHIAAVTAERDKSKVLVDAAKDVCEKIEPLLPESVLSSIYNTLSNALKQYNP